ncbi:MAG: hypothetical protein ACJ790_14085 [Myxococcaceae bacterium]
MRALPLLSLLLATTAFADKASVRVLSTSELNAERQRRLAVAAEVALKELSGFQVEEGGKADVVAPPVGAKKSCILEPSCAIDVAKTTESQHVLVLHAKVVDGKLLLDGQLVDLANGKASHKSVEEGNPSEPEAAAKQLVELIVPPWARKGWGGLRVAEDTENVKVDGVMLDDTARKEPLPLPAGRHEVDVLLPDGSAVLQRLEIGEGSRAEVRQEALPSATFVEPGKSFVGTTRYVGYGMWAAGAVCVAGSFIAGALSRQALKDVRPCEGADRSCTNFQDADAARRRSESYATTGNVLLGLGGGLALTGAGLVTWDLLGK